MILDLYVNDIPPTFNPDIIIPFNSNKEQQLQEVRVLLESSYDYVIFTDGSTLKEESKCNGKTGASAVIYKNTIASEPAAVLKKSLGIMCNNYVAEIVGVQLGLKYIDSCDEIGAVIFFVDCVPAMKASFEMDISKEYSSISVENKMLTKKLLDKGWQISATWMPAHEGFAPNELADKIAKECASNAVAALYPCDRKILLNQLKENVVRNWQFRYNLNCSDHRIYSIVNTVNCWFWPKMKGLAKVFQLVSGQHKLNSCQFRFNPCVVSDRCTCGKRETPDHFLFECEKYSRLRYDLCKKISLRTSMDYTNLADVGWGTLMGQNDMLSLEVRTEILKDVVQFVVDSKRI